MSDHCPTRCGSNESGETSCPIRRMFNRAAGVEVATGVVVISGSAVFVDCGGVSLGEITVVVGNAGEIGPMGVEIGPQDARRKASQSESTKMQGAFISRPSEYIGNTLLSNSFLV